MAAHCPRPADPLTRCVRKAEGDGAPALRHICNPRTLNCQVRSLDFFLGSLFAQSADLSLRKAEGEQLAAAFINPKMSVASGTSGSKRFHPCANALKLLNLLAILTSTNTTRITSGAKGVYGRTPFTTTCLAAAMAIFSDSARKAGGDSVFRLSLTQGWHIFLPSPFISDAFTNMLIINTATRLFGKPEGEKVITVRAAPVPTRASYSALLCFSKLVATAPEC